MSDFEIVSSIIFLLEVDDMESMGNSEKKGFIWYVTAGPIALAALMFSVYVGPGFASGVLTVGYLLTKGSLGVFIGPLVLGVVTFLFCLLFYEFNRVYRPAHYRESYNMMYRNPILRQILGIYADLVTNAGLILLVAVMANGAANLLKNVTGLPLWAGTILFSVCVLILTMKGIGLVVKAGSVLTVCIIFIIVYIGIIGIGPLWDKIAAFAGGNIPPSRFGFTTGSAWLIILGFTVSQVCGTSAVVPACLNGLYKRSHVVVAAAGTALFTCFANIIFAMVLSAGMPEVTKEPIPILYVFENVLHVSSLSRILYFIIAVAAMVSTGVGMIYGTEARFHGYFKKLIKIKSDVVVRLLFNVILIAGCMFLSKFGIVAIINKGYVLLTTVSAPLLVYLLFFVIPWRMTRDKKNKTGPYAETDSR
jgi:uncharacterized membrane protein YkvI